jgi:glyoxylase-like metal-dependent hydrolase (beta-lactamase superfamily II)
MIVNRLFEPLLAQNSYLIGCGASGQAIVIDPSRDISPYLNAAEAEHLEITLVTETHIHADYLSGSRELAQRTGAKPCFRMRATPIGSMDSPTKPHEFTAATGWRSATSRSMSCTHRDTRPNT